MYTKYLGISVGATILIALSALNVPAHADEVDDLVTSARVDMLFLSNEYLSASTIDVHTLDGVVTLTGHVDDAVEYRLAESLAQAVEGVYRVENKLEIYDWKQSEVERESSAKRDVSRQQFRNANLAARVDSQIAYYDDLDGTDIRVSADDGAITLEGVVSTNEQSQIAENAARIVPGVTSVENKLAVAEDSVAENLEDAAVGVMEGVRDEWIEKRVERRMAFNRTIHVFDLNIEVNNQVCILSGHVPTDTQRTLAETIASSTKGVKNVVNEIVVLPDSQ